MAALTNKLTIPYADSISKLRSIFIWITDNIEYDYKLSNSGDDRWRHFSCKGNKETCAQARLEWENGVLEHVLSTKKAVCSGYSFLFKKMCNIIGIQNEMIPGYTKMGPQHIGIPLNVTHDWNIVKMGDETFVCDATWASGGVKVNEETGKPYEFVKQYQNYYWLTPLNKFARNHHPKDAKWILESNATKESFFNAPYFYPGELSINIERNLPDSGVIKSKVGDTIHFEFTCNYQVQKIHVTTNNYRNTEMLFSGKSQQSNNIYKFDYVVKENSLYYIDILFDEKKAIRYRVKY
ncbi:transglutaminase domain-containing protein [Ferruginibacter sp.]